MYWCRLFVALTILAQSVDAQCEQKRNTPRSWSSTAVTTTRPTNWSSTLTTSPTIWSSTTPTSSSTTEVAAASSTARGHAVRNLRRKMITLRKTNLMTRLPQHNNNNNNNGKRKTRQDGEHSAATNASAPPRNHFLHLAPKQIWPPPARRTHAPTPAVPAPPRHKRTGFPPPPVAPPVVPPAAPPPFFSAPIQPPAAYVVPNAFNMAAPPAAQPPSSFNAPPSAFQQQQQPVAQSPPAFQPPASPPAAPPSVPSAPLEASQAVPPPPPPAPLPLPPQQNFVQQPAAEQPYYVEESYSPEWYSPPQPPAAQPASENAIVPETVPEAVPEAVPPSQSFTEEVPATTTEEPSPATTENDELRYPLPECYTDDSALMCCNSSLEDTMKRAFNDLVNSQDQFHRCNVQRIAHAVQLRSEDRFNTSFEVIAGIEDYASRSHFFHNLICKIERDGRFILAYATARPELDSVDIGDGLSEEEAARCLANGYGTAAASRGGDADGDGASRNSQSAVLNASRRVANNHAGGAAELLNFMFTFRRRKQ